MQYIDRKFLCSIRSSSLGRPEIRLPAPSRRTCCLWLDSFVIIAYLGGDVKGKVPAGGIRSNFALIPGENLLYLYPLGGIAGLILLGSLAAWIVPPKKDAPHMRASLFAV